MSLKKKLQERYFAKRAAVNHIKRCRRAGKRFYPVYIPIRQVDKPVKAKRRTYYAPAHLPYGPTLEYLWSVHKNLSRKINFFNLSKSEIILYVPKQFSLVENCSESYKFVFELFFLLYKQKYPSVIIDYQNCENLDLDGQVLMDVIIKEFIDFLKECKRQGKRTFTRSISLRNYNRPEISKILYSIGSFKIHKNVQIDLPNIIPYHLCIGSKSKSLDEFAGSEKEIHVTELVDYIQKCLGTVERRLTIDARSELCEVIGEILINAEEHSTTQNRYSIGYFEYLPDQAESKRYGIFNLVIFNFGKSMYEKFKDPNCPAKHIVKRMEELSSHYTRNLFFQENFKEESLWTLYALQEGVTSIADKKRGNGSIRFIDSFFKLKGSGINQDNISKLTLISGNTRITFNGEYQIEQVVKNGNKFNIMAFNKNNNIEEKPDKKYVTFADHYFPGTMIVAKICISEDDLIQTRKS